MKLSRYTVTGKASLTPADDGEVVWYRDAQEAIDWKDAEIERLKEAYELTRRDCLNLTEKVIPNIKQDKDAEIERLKAENERLQSGYETMFELVASEKATVANLSQIIGKYLD